MPESKGRTSQYEAMFLISQADATDLDAAVNHIRTLLDRAHAEVIALRKWDERRLAYEIGKHKRGTYFLAYFSCDPIRVETLQRDCNLSETIVRCMIIRADHLTRDQMESSDRGQQLHDEAALRGDDSFVPAEASAEA